MSWLQRFFVFSSGYLGGEFLMEVRTSSNLQSPLHYFPFLVIDTNSMILQSGKSEKQI